MWISCPPARHFLNSWICPADAVSPLPSKGMKKKKRPSYFSFSIPHSALSLPLLLPLLPPLPPPSLSSSPRHSPSLLPPPQLGPFLSPSPSPSTLLFPLHLPLFSPFSSTSPFPWPSPSPLSSDLYFISYQLLSPTSPLCLT